MDKAAERLKKLEEQKREIERKMQTIRARQSATERKKDTRRKVLAGAFLLGKVEKGEFDKADFLRGMDGFLSRDIDRALFGLPSAVEAVNEKENGQGGLI